MIHNDAPCAVCNKTGFISKIDTYKSTWLYCGSCRCYSRSQKTSYPLEWLASALIPLFKHVPKLNGFLLSLGRKKQGIDFYRYYSAQLASGERGPWAGQSDMVTGELRGAGLLSDWAGVTVLELSGEPGFFAQDLMQLGADVTVSAFAEDVADAMAEHLGVKTFTYDFNVDDLVQKTREKTGSKSFDFIFIRFAIGFCLDVPALMQSVSALLKPGGLLYISFSPASRAVLLRWMFDDYTYLRQFTEEYLTATAVAAGLEFHTRADEGYFHWDRGPFSLHWSLRPLARRYFKANSFYVNGVADDSVQRRCALIYRKT